MESGFSSFPQANFDEFVKRLESSTASLPKQEAKLAQFILLNLGSLGLETGRSLASKVGVSEVTVGRLLRRLGCDGMKGLKVLLRQHYSVTTASLSTDGEVPSSLEGVHEAELAAITSIFRQTTGKDWRELSRLLVTSSVLYVTGFQSVRGTAEDFSRRLALARNSVHFLSPHDGMLGEWLTDQSAENRESCLVLIDVVPYASEAPKLARLAKQQGRSCVVVSDEYCHWSRDIADAVVYAPSQTGLFLESTVGIVMALSLMVDVVANADSDTAAERLVQWKSNSKKMGLF